MADDVLGRVAVVVVNFGEPDLLRAGLARVADDLAPATVVVVDNFSTPQARARVRELCEAEGWIGVFPDVNTGFGTGCNLGAQAAVEAGARQLLFLNPDATIDRRSAERLTEACAGRNALVAPTVLHPDGSIASAGMELDLRTGDMRGWRRRAGVEPTELLAWVSGCCFMLDTTLWTALGGFDDDYFLYWEDVDLCARAHAHGAAVHLIEGAVATHEGGRTHTRAGARAKSATYYYFNVRNRQLFARKWLPEDQQKRWRRTSPSAAYRILLRGGRRQFLHPRAPLSAAWRGLRDGSRMPLGTRSAAGATPGPELVGGASRALRSPLGQPR